MKKILFAAFVLALFGWSKLQAQCLDLTNCPTTTLEYCSLNNNNPEFWNDPLYNEEHTASDDLYETATNLNISIHNTCGGIVTVKFFLFLDLDNNGTRETVVKSHEPPPAGMIYFNNAQNPNFDGGTLLPFDERPAASGDLYNFSIEQTVNGTETSASMRWNTVNNPGNYVLPQLPAGFHKIKWMVENDQGEVDICEYSFNVRDCKKPTIVCINGLTANLMPTGLVTIWAADYLQYIEDNATPSNQLKIAVVRSELSTGQFPVDAFGNPITSTDFNCNDIGTNFVQVWVKDAEGNADYCETYIIISDVNGNCPATDSIYLNICARNSCDDNIVPFYLGTNDPYSCLDTIYQPVFPGANVNYVPTNGNDPSNGVTVLDVLKIRKHILGIESLAMPYGVIAADVNHSGSVTTFDMVTMLKVIGGLFNEFPLVPSWQFIDADFVFPNPNNPFQTVVPGSFSIASITPDSLYSFHAVAIKTGDVNCDALPGFNGEDDSRSNIALTLPDCSLKASETMDIALRIPAAAAISATQFGLYFDPSLLVVESVQMEGLPGDAVQTAMRPRDGVINIVWLGDQTQLKDGDCLLRLRVHAQQNLQLRDVLSLGDLSTHSPALVYNDNEGARQPVLAFAANNLPSATDHNTVYQPYPNPGSGKVLIPVSLIGSSDLQVTVTDINGKILYTRSQRAAEKGAYQLEIPADVFPYTGLYFWQVQAGDTISSGKLERF